MIYPNSSLPRRDRAGQLPERSRDHRTGRDSLSQGEVGAADAGREQGKREQATERVRPRGMGCLGSRLCDTERPCRSPKPRLGQGSPGLRTRGLAVGWKSRDETLKGPAHGRDAHHEDMAPQGWASHAGVRTEACRPVPVCLADGAEPSEMERVGGRIP